MVSLNLRTELTKAILIELGEGKTSIASETTTPYPFGKKDIV
jgi:hypothetical protein